MSDHDAFERRAASAGVALRAAFLVDQPVSPSLPTTVPTAVDVRVRPPAARRPHRGLAAAAAALAAAAAAVGAFVLASQRTEPVDVLGSGAERETAVLAPPYLVGSGTLPEADKHSVQRFPVPFTFSTPPVDPASGSWRYRTGSDFDVGVGRHGVILLAPTETYAPGRTWQGQTQLVPAPTDAAGWAEWLEGTGYVDVTEREDLQVGGAPATRFTVELNELPDAYDGCGGGRRCVAIEPFDDPGVGPGRVGTGPQSGLDSSVAELTVIELEERAILALAGGPPRSTDAWLSTLRRLVDSLRFA